MKVNIKILSVLTGNEYWISPTVNFECMIEKDVKRLITYKTGGNKTRICIIGKK